MSKSFEFTSADRRFMVCALRLARRGLRFVPPNPTVGCVLVRDGKIIGQGYHRRFGGNHAEVDALNNAVRSPKGATAYVTLDPCCHTGKTEPCTEAFLKAGVSRIISAIEDPHDAKRSGEVFFRRHGVEFFRGLCREEAFYDLQWYFKIVQESLPYVMLKVATTLDGKMATKSGVSNGITSGVSLRAVHRLRAACDALLVGGGTVEADNPHLGVRYVRGKDPLRVVLDRDLSCDPKSSVFRDANAIVFATKKAPARRVKFFTSLGVCVEILSYTSYLPSVLTALFKRGIYHILAECGSILVTEFLRLELADRYIQFISPKLLGGRDSPTPFGGGNPADLKRAITLTSPHYRRLGQDFFVEGLLQTYQP